MLIACERETLVGDELLVSFRAPGREELWFDAEAVVARVIAGQRSNDNGYSAGLEFTYFEKCARHELLSRLAGFPPPVPKRRLRDARARGASRRRAWWCGRSSWFGASRCFRSCAASSACPRGVFVS